MTFVLSLLFPLLFLSLRWWPFALSSTLANPRHLRTLGEHCDEMAFPCEPALQCILMFGKRTCRAAATELAISRCSLIQCPPVDFPTDCPHDTVPVLLQSAEQEVLSDGDESADGCCPSLVKCQCDPKKCLIPACPDGTERVLVQLGSGQPEKCCDRFECRQTECEGMRCPDPLDMLDLYSSDGMSCPPDSYRPAPYVPPGSCCPIISQCTCRVGFCEPARQCSADELLVVRRRGGGEPGKCCDQFECRSANESQENAKKCRHGDRFFAVGEIWHSAPCEECQCGSGGISKCRRMECPKLTQGCTWVGILPGECCPVCLGCRDENGISYEQDELWEHDECTNCTCLDFRWQCQKFICKTECEKPKRVPGECCPICDAPTIVKSPSSFGCPSLQKCPRRCEFGLVQNRLSGCFECECAEMNKSNDGNTETKCEPLTERNCARLCAHGYLRDQNGCSICRCAHCPPLGDRCGLFNDLFHIFVPPYLTVPSDTLAPFSPHSAPLHCLSGVTERDIGEWWTDSECWQCFCQHGKEFCSLIVCPPRADECPAEHWTRSSESQCCPRCLSPAASSPQNWTFSSPPLPIEQRHFSHVCHSPGNGLLFVDGETWHLNECIACTCRMGHVLCSWNGGQQCPPVPCDRPVFDLASDQCCPRCPPSPSEEEEDKAQSVENATETVEQLLSIGDQRQYNNCVDTQSGTAYGTGANWRRDVCQSCKCLSDGQVQCFREQCSTNSSDRMLSLKGRCCPIGADSLRAMSAAAFCTYNGKIFTRGEQFKDGPCRNCTCLEGGAIQCSEIHCPTCGNEEENTENKTAEEKKQGECCSSCKAELPESPPSVIVYSSFERGTEDQILFIGENGIQNENSAANSWEQRHLWLMVAVSSLVLTALFTLFTAFVLAGRKCRMIKGTAFKKSAGGNISNTFCLPNSQNERRKTADEESGGVGTSLLDGTDSTRTDSTM
ncbi:hypothetical protein niasHS_010991 [Heterodera schachtii]|uniref:Cysteine-rich motor neuron 1 protein n=1 Tax=Heterodera schachtii TaxID=97005 RepID=A0ABD2IT65_HETSC